MRTPEIDYYAVLGVSRTASTDEIHHAYRTLARRFHPDLNPGNRSAAESFRRVQEAYDVLRHPREREMYDAPRAAEPPPACDQAASHPAVDFSSFDGDTYTSRGTPQPLRRRVALLALRDFAIGLAAIASVSGILLAAIAPHAPWWLTAIPVMIFAAGFLLGRDVLSLMVGLSFSFLGLGPMAVNYLARIQGYVDSELYARQHTDEVRMYIAAGIAAAIVPAVCGALVRRTADERERLFLQGGWTAYPDDY